jgi:hypothetical protein
MFRIANLAGVLSLAGSVWVIALTESWAQQPYDYGSVVYEAARNKIGLMRYCRNNALLSAGIADKVAAAVRSGLLKVGSAIAKDKGDIAENAGEDGFWEANRRRDIASIAKMFGATPAELCSEWAKETLRTPQPGRSRDAPPPSASPRPARASAPVVRPPGNVDRRRVRMTRPAPKPSDKPQVPAKAVAVPEAAKTPVAAKREEPTVNWSTGPITVWSTVRVQARPARERADGTVTQNRKQSD